MTQIIPYETNVLPQGQVAGQATSDAFGGQVAQAMGQVGAAVGKIGEEQFKVEQDQGRIWAYDQSSKAYSDLKEGYQQSVNSLDPTDPDFTKKVSHSTKQLALRKALSRFYPVVNTIHLDDYKVRVVDSEAGTAAKVRVFIEFRDEKNLWTTVGVSENIIDASWKALVEAVEYKLTKG